MTSRFLLMSFLLISAGLFSTCSYANQCSDDFVNQQYAEHLNYYYDGLNVSIVPGADPKAVYTELQNLEDFQSKKLNGAHLLPPIFEHISCTGGPCGGCTHGAC